MSRARLIRSAVRHDTLSRVTTVLIVGAGKGGRALLEMLVGDPTVTIAGISDVNPWAPGIDLARRLNLPIATDFREMVANPGVDLVIDVTGDQDVHRTIHAMKAPATEVMG